MIFVLPEVCSVVVKNHSYTQKTYTRIEALLHGLLPAVTYD